MKKMRKLLLLFFFMFLALCTSAQNFFNLTASEVKIDSLLPCFNYQQPLGPHYADSVYEVSIIYPEFIPMSEGDVARYQALSTDCPAALPQIDSHVSVVRKQGILNVSFVPIVFRDGKYQKLVSFMLEIKTQPQPQTHPQPLPCGRGAKIASSNPNSTPVREGQGGGLALSLPVAVGSRFASPRPVSITFLTP